MNRKILISLVCILVALGYSFLHKIPFNQNDYKPEGLEESIAKKLWMEKMLMDPSTGKIPEGFHHREMAFLASYQEQYASIYSNKNRNATWNARGPWNVGGRTRAFAIDVNDQNHIIAGAVSGGIWQSFDAGANWQKVSAPNAHPGCVSIAQDTRPGMTNIWYALSGEIYGTSASGGGAFYLGDGAYRSLDNGSTWTAITSTAGGLPNGFSLNYQGGWRIATSPVDSVDACVYMATYGSIYRSIDTGKSWTAVLGAGNDSYFSDVVVSATGIVYACLSSDGKITKGFYRSADGIHFTNITPTFLKSADRTVLTINPNNENEVYFISELPSDTSGGVATYNYEGTPEYVSLLKYTYINGDGSGTGGSWSNLSTNLPIYTQNQFDKFNTQGGYDLVVKVQPGTNHVVIGGTNLYISTDGFTSQNNTKQIGGYAIATTLPNFGVYPNHHPDQHDIFFNKTNPKQAYSISDGGVKFTTDINANNVSWNDVSLGYITSQFYSIAIDASKSYDQYLLGGLQDNGNYMTRSSNLKSEWLMNINGDGAHNYIAPDRKFYIISTQLGNVRKVLLDERGNVMAKKRIDPAGYDKSVYNFINHLTVDPNTNDILYMPIAKRLARLADLKSIECTNDNNKLTSGWAFSADTITTPNLSNGASAEITFIATANKPANTLYLGTSNREIYKVENAHNSNMTFKKLTTNRLPNGGYISGIAVDPDTADNILVCYSNYNIASLFFSRNGGISWQYVGGNLEGNQNSSSTNPSIRCVNILKDADGRRHYFAGTSIGLFSTDTLKLDSVNAFSNKTIWKQESPDGIGAAIVTDIKVRHSDGYVVVATHGNGIYESYFTGNPPPTPKQEIDVTYIYPNPANSYFNYTFSTKTEDIHQAVIIDAMGRKVKTIFNSTFPIGNFTIRVDISDLPTGYYFAALYTKSSQRPLVKPFIVQL